MLKNKPTIGWAEKTERVSARVNKNDRLSFLDEPQATINQLFGIVTV